jgi:NAD(P)-dependent dehydrogenase (short-subunit alcohol dehydrogenase family)
MITGASSGIGKAAATELARMGATVVIVCRNQNSGERALADIKAKGGESADLMISDLSSQGSIRKLVKDFMNKYQKLHVLINNAGVFLAKRTLTEDGIEMTFAVNHLAPFLLTNLLLDLLKSSAPARIVNVSSVAHYRGHINFDDLQGEESYSGIRAYNQSKLANVLFTYELAKRLTGNGITANCLHPGAVATNLVRRNSGIYSAVWKMISPFMLSPEKGARTCVHLASSPEVEGVTGKYFVKETAVRSSKESYDETVSKRLWEISMQLTRLTVSQTR